MPQGNEMMTCSKKIIEGCIKGDHQCQKALYDLFSNSMYSVALRYCKSRNDAGEVLQNGFIKVFKSIDKVKEPNQLAAWIKRIIVNTAIDYLKKRKRLSFEELDVQAIDSFPVTMSQKSLERINYKDLLALLNELPKGYSTVFSMYVLDNMSHDEIAEITSISASTSRSQLFKARKMMQKLVIEKFGCIPIN